jgi:Flp pilus assembly protein TadG
VTGCPQGPARLGRGSPAHRSAGERGQSLVEFVLVLGPLLLIMFGILELGLVMFDKVTVVNDAREAARLASVNDASGKTLLGDAPAGSSLTFTCSTDPNSGNAQGSWNVGDKVTAHVTYVHSFVTPLISGLLGSTINLSSNATMTLEAQPTNFC